MAKGTQLWDKERAHFSLAQLKKGGETFEVIVDPDAAMAFKSGSVADVREVLKYEKVFADAQKGQLASEAAMQAAFSTSDPVEVARAILEKGRVQVTEAYREGQRDAKRKQLVDMISRNAIDPRTNLPHPPQRIENAFAQAKVHIDEGKSAQDQLTEVLDRIRPILPVKFETRKLQLLIPAKFASKSYSAIKGYGSIERDEWQNDGSLLAVIELPAGMQPALVDQLNKLTRGEVDIKILK